MYINYQYKGGAHFYTYNALVLAFLFSRVFSRVSSSLATEDSVLVSD